MAKQIYSEKLKHPKWQMRRLEIMKRDKATCQICGDKETELHIHHLKYTGEPWDAPNQDLQTVCKCCHNSIEQLKGNCEIIKGEKLTTERDGVTHRHVVYKTSIGAQSFKINDDNTTSWLCGFMYNSKVLELINKMIK